MAGMAEVEIVGMQEVSRDARRVISEAMTEESGFIRYGRLVITSKDALGNHAHAGGDEEFVLLSGKGILHTVQIDEAGNSVGEVSSQQICAPCVIVIPKLVAHTFQFPDATLDSPAEMVSRMIGTFKDACTISCILI